MTEIYFVRHAESYGNLTRRAYGWYDGVVTPKGYKQIECLKKRFEDIKIDVVYSSDLIRTDETAKAIYKPNGIPIVYEKGFREIGFGIWEDRPWGEFPQKNPETYHNWTYEPLKFQIEGGETYKEVYHRARLALDRIVSENDGKTIVIVSHGATLRMLMHGIVNNDDLSEITNATWGDNTSVSLFKACNGKYVEVFKNDNSHLCSMPDVDENMRWVREGGGRNIWFNSIKVPRDQEKLRKYHREAWLEIFGDEPPSNNDIDARVKRILKQDKNNIALGYSRDEEVGIIELDNSVKLHPLTGHISLLYLKPEFRRMRYGIQLIGYAMSKYYQEGKKHISVRVAENNKTAYEFYKKYGFYEIKREMQSGFCQIIMILDITRKDD